MLRHLNKKQSLTLFLECECFTYSTGEIVIHVYYILLVTISDKMFFWLTFVIKCLLDFLDYHF